ncbi:MAG TPA: helix-turn-helix domain-containing protein [Streptosporangiaceae bacterium]|nr:helix-turn-helix domain-containing protein [Streptosporangiaceae bacterium]
MSLYDRVESKPGGKAALAAARLRREVLVALHEAFAASDVHTQSEVAERLNVRKSAVSQVFRGDGNLRINTLADYLFALGFELNIQLVVAGEPRRAELEGRTAVPVGTAWNTAFSIVFTATADQYGLVGRYTSIQPVQMWLFAQVEPYKEFDPLPNSTSGKIIVGKLAGE